MLQDDMFGLECLLALLDVDGKDKTVKFTSLLL